jgi:hypothetical protein
MLSLFYFTITAGFCKAYFDISAGRQGKARRKRPVYGVPGALLYPEDRALI